MGDEEQFAEDLDRLLGAEGERAPLVCVHRNRWTLVEFRATGRLRQVSVRVGASREYVADVPERVPVPVGDAASLPALVARCAPAEPMEMRAEAAADAVAYLTSLTVKEAALAERDADLVSAVTAELASRVHAFTRTAGGVDPSGRRPCRNCDGLAPRAEECFCKNNGLHYLGVVAAPGEVIVDEPSGEVVAPAGGAPVFDPDCPQCHGTGTCTWGCPVCDGSGVEPVAVDWVIDGPDGVMSVRLDVAALLRAGDARLVVDSQSGNRFVRVTVAVDFTALTERIDGTVAAGQPTWGLAGDHHRDWPLRASATFQWDLEPVDGHGEPGSVLTGADGPFRYSSVGYTRAGQQHGPWVEARQAVDGLPSGAGIVDRLQVDMSGNTHTYPGDPREFGYGADGRIETVPWGAVVKLSTGALLARLVRVAEDAGYGIGLTYGFIGTGEAGPAVYLVDEELRTVASLGLGYTWQEAAAEALHCLPGELDRLAC